MAIGVVASESFAAEMAALGITRDLENKVNAACDALVEDRRMITRGRGARPEVPMGLRALIAEEKTLGASSKELQDVFGISASSVSAYGAGATSTASYDTKQPELVESIDAANTRIGRIATHKLLRALDAITDGKVADLSPLKAADLASKMSAVIRNTRADDSEKASSGVKIVVFQPRVKEEDEYQVINILDE
jgi:hypothetical protein